MATLDLPPNPSFANPAGRDWRFSRWCGEKHFVVFDSNSGDFWIVSKAARRVVESLGGGPRSRNELIALVCSDPDISIGQIDAESVIEDLLAQKLIVTPSK